MAVTIDELRALPGYPLGPGNVDAPWDWGIPNWREPDRYPDTVETPIHAWRWQFLRRDRRYRKVWCDYCANSEEWLAARAGKESLFQEISRSFNITSLIDPAAPEIDELFGVFPEIFAGSAAPAFFGFDQIEDFVQLAASQGWYLAAIDPCGPIKEQLAKAHKTIKSWESDWGGVKQKRNIGLPFRLYLRLIDARENDPGEPSWREITDVINAERAAYVPTGTRKPRGDRDRDNMENAYVRAKATQTGFVTGLWTNDRSV